ncbi:MAG: T9SS type A sorting domain-containing protein [Saprospirales bacterium]|nr:T9SS type A sorting domain-containing protein [Saprospirales bacterium]MBK8490920.1 T9SS type A sorting domain-containing protein [Saprospirales bacterium]
MKRIITLFTFLAFTCSLQAQSSVTVSVGNGYSTQVYYTMANDAVTTLANNAWDLAFTTGPTDGGVFTNEAANSGSNPVQLWLAPTWEWSDIINPAMLEDSLYNPETDWETGAFNSVKDPLDPSDFGWGFYSEIDNEAIGVRVYALQLRDGSWKKIMIDSLIAGVYYWRYADLDGANETNMTIDKADFAGSPLVYFSFDTEASVASPSGWDLLFTRYLAPLELSGEIVPYPSTGVLSGFGVEVAEAQGVNPATVNYEDYLDSLDTHLDVIGQDWKEFNLTTFSWVLDPNRAYFVKLADNNLWKVVFTAFGGSGTGNITFEKTFVATITGVEEAGSNFTNFGVFPNPAVDELTVAFSLVKSQEVMPLTLVNSLGQEVWRMQVSGTSGLNVWQIDLPGLSNGLYYLIAGNGNEVVSTPVHIQN